MSDAIGIEGVDGLLEERRMNKANARVDEVFCKKPEAADRGPSCLIREREAGLRRHIEVEVRLRALLEGVLNSTCNLMVVPKLFRP